MNIWALRCDHAPAVWHAPNHSRQCLDRSQAVSRMAGNATASNALMTLQGSLYSPKVVMPPCFLPWERASEAARFTLSLCPVDKPSQTIKWQDSAASTTTVGRAGMAYLAVRTARQQRRPTCCRQQMTCIVEAETQHQNDMRAEGRLRLQLCHSGVQPYKSSPGSALIRCLDCNQVMLA